MNPFWSPAVQDGVKPLTPAGDAIQTTGIARGVMEQNGEAGMDPQTSLEAWEEIKALCRPRWMRWKHSRILSEAEVSFEKEMRRLALAAGQESGDATSFKTASSGNQGVPVCDPHLHGLPQRPPGLPPVQGSPIRTGREWPMPRPRRP